MYGERWGRDILRTPGDAWSDQYERTGAWLAAYKSGVLHIKWRQHCCVKLGMDPITITIRVATFDWPPACLNMVAFPRSRISRCPPLLVGFPTTKIAYQRSKQSVLGILCGLLVTRRSAKALELGRSFALPLGEPRGEGPSLG